jgi:hypothetical protein
MCILIEKIEKAIQAESKSASIMTKEFHLNLTHSFSKNKTEIVDNNGKVDETFSVSICDIITEVELTQKDGLAIYECALCDMKVFNSYFNFQILNSSFLVYCCV